MVRKVEVGKGLDKFDNTRIDDMTRGGEFSSPVENHIDTNTKGQVGKDLIQ